MTKLKRGWLKRQIANAKKDFAKWPKWMKRESQLAPQKEGADGNKT